MEDQVAKQTHEWVESNEKIKGWVRETFRKNKEFR